MSWVFIASGVMVRVVTVAAPKRSVIHILTRDVLVICVRKTVFMTDGIMVRVVTEAVSERSIVHISTRDVLSSHHKWRNGQSGDWSCFWKVPCSYFNKRCPNDLCSENGVLITSGMMIRDWTWLWLLLKEEERTKKQRNRFFLTILLQVYLNHPDITALVDWV